MIDSYTQRGCGGTKRHPRESDIEERAVPTVSGVGDYGWWRLQPQTSLKLEKVWAVGGLGPS